MSDPSRGPGPSTIEQCVAAWQRARASLAGDDALADDEAAITSALMSDPMVLHPDELLRRIVRALTFAMLREGEARTLIAIYRARQRRYANRAMILRTEIFDIMQALRRHTYPAPEGTISIRAGSQSVLITDEGLIPDEYWITPPRVLDRQALLDDLKQGVVVEGAALSNGAETLAMLMQKGSTATGDDDAATGEE
jgi:hypothetical protein